MSTVGGAIIYRLIDQGVLAASAVFRDVAPDGAVTPYATVIEPISDHPEFFGDSQVLYRKEMAQVSLFQTQAAESDTLRRALVNALDGAPLVADEVVLRCRVMDVHRIPEDVYKRVHHAVTVEVVHAP